MSWLRKLVQVFAVIGLAALSSIPFKRNAPQTSSAQGPSTDSRVASDSANSGPNAASASSPELSKTNAAITTSIPSSTTGTAASNDAASSTVGATSNSESDAGKARAGAAASSGNSVSNSAATPAIPPATSYGVTDSAAKVSDFSSSDRPLPEADASADRPAAVARLEIRAPRIVGDPPRDVRIRDDEPVPAMGPSFQPLWQPEASKRRIAEPDGKPGAAGGRRGDSSDSGGAQPSGQNASASATGGDQTDLLKHRVAYGDSLENLAQQYLGDGSRAEAIYELNRQRIPDRFSLPVGVELSIPKLGD